MNPTDITTSPTTATILKISSIARLECSECGAKVDAACNCGAPYVPAGVRAAKAIAENPEKSDRAIATDLGIGKDTVRRIRKSTGAHAPVEKRTGKDGKVRRLPNKRNGHQHIAAKTKTPVQAKAPATIDSNPTITLAPGECTTTAEATDFDEKPVTSRKEQNSRADRWAYACHAAAEAIEELLELQDEYQSWRDGLPENLQSSEVSEKLDTVCELDFEGARAIIEEANDADLPLGFGRD